MSGDVYEALQAIRADADSRRLLQLLRKEASGAPGWQIARTLGKEPVQMAATLDKLSSLGILKSQGGAGLDGYYYLTGIGYQIMGELQTAL